jgi:acyl-CoA synthetase (NDP forming)
MIEAGARRSALARLLCPATIAFVGLSDNSYFCRTVRPTLDGDAEIFMVNPRYDTVLGRPAVPSLTDIGRPVDAVLSCMSAERTTELIELLGEAAGLDVGGVVLIANGFAEIGGEGEALQARLTAAARAAGVAAIGPNGLGFINVPHRVSLTIASHHKRRPGGISIVSHSGAMLSGAAMAAWSYPDCGLNVLVSAGNEAVTDLADYVDYFVTDPETKAIGLILEKIRRPAEFFAAVRRATEAGKPTVVLKLARTEQSRQMAASHTGALTGEAWVYDAALRQAGVALAYDVEELIDRLAAASVAIQPMIQASGEALLGIQGESELGPLVVLGLGGVFVEVLNRVGGRMAPFTTEVARDLIEEFADLKVMHGFRGRPGWDLDALAGILVAAGQLAARGREWIATLDINPLLWGPEGFGAVDALLLVRASG